MTNRTLQGLNRAKKFLLASAGVAALAGPIAIGVLIGIGHAPAIRAQSPTGIQPGTAGRPQSVPAAPGPGNAPAAAQSATASRAELRYQDRRLVAMLFDFDTMTPDDQSRARQGAIDFVQTRMQPADIVAVMAVDNGKMSIAQDFTSDRVVLESVILKLSAGNGHSSVPGIGARLSSIEGAAKLLAGFPGRKTLIYFSSGFTHSEVDHQAEFLNAIDTLKKSNVAIYPIDARGIAPQVTAQSGSGGRSMRPPSAPAGTSPDENNRRLAYAQAKFGSTVTGMGRIYVRYGPPDQIDDRSSEAQKPSETWRYNYLANFRSNVEFEFALGNGGHGVRINWPPPQATYEGVPSVVATLAEALSREGQDRGGPVAAKTIAGLPGRRASFQIYPAGEIQTLSVPLDSLSGLVDILGQIEGQIKTRLDTGAAVENVATVRDSIQASAGTYQSGFTLPAGSYVCGLIVRERATGRMYGETINFEVK